MNRAYRLVWNESQQAWVPAPEYARSKGKSGGARTLIAAMALISGGAFALPTGGQVSLGQGSISQTGSTTLSVSQQSQNLSINWNSFNIGSSETVNFNQPSSSAVALNRILGSDPSQIYGHLNANGQVFLINPNGVLFGQTAQVNVGGLVASTLNITDKDFAAGNYHFSGTAGSVTNEGSISVSDGGYVALLGGQVSNEGSISARLGSVDLAAGTDVTIDFAGDGLLSLQVNQGAVNALAENRQLIEAQGGQVLMTARAANSLATAVVNNAGMVDATSIQNQNGVISLVGDSSNGVITNAGSLSASTVDASAHGILQSGSISGGSIDLSAGLALLQTASGTVTSSGGSITLDGGSNTFLSGSVDASGSSSGGNVTITGQSITLADASVSASGSSTAGSIWIGGGYHGKNASISNADTVAINPSSQINLAGSGAQLAIWSQSSTGFFGSLSTGANADVEVSSKGTLSLGGSIKTGNDSAVLFDPTDIIIDATAPASLYLDLAPPDNITSGNDGSGGVLDLSHQGGDFYVTGNIVVSSPDDNFGGSQAGAVYVYDHSTGALVSALYGSHAGDQLGAVNGGSGIINLYNGNFVVDSPNWNSGAGAVSFVSGTTGSSGFVSAANSLVGSVSTSDGTTGDHVGGTTESETGSGIVLLNNGNYVVDSPWWSSSTGAVTWGSGTSGVSGVVSASNSIVGANPGDQVGSQSDYSASIVALENGNYAIASPMWGGGMGAVTVGDGSAGTVVGVASTSNSLVGSTAGDMVGYDSVTSAPEAIGVTALGNSYGTGEFVVTSPNWNGQAGAITMSSGVIGSATVGAISSNNSVVGSTQTNVAQSIVGDELGARLGNGASAVTEVGPGYNFVVDNYLWDGQAGAVTWGNGSGTGQLAGFISAANSLVGINSGGVITHIGGGVNNDGVGGVVSLNNGNYVVNSPNFSYLNVNASLISSAGAVTWGDGTNGTLGSINGTDDSNSLIGVASGDQIGSKGITVLGFGDYVVDSPNWNGGVGAVTWASGTAATIGNVVAGNSLTGATEGDEVGSGGVVALPGGNYVVVSPIFGNHVGAVTWGDGEVSGGTVGTVSSSNSLTGSFSGDNVGGLNYNDSSTDAITVLNNGNYVVSSPLWSNGTGAVTWGSASDGVSGVVSNKTNSLTGSTSNGDTTGGDYVGLLNINFGYTNGVLALSNGNYLVVSSGWSGNRGAVTFVDGSSGAIGGGDNNSFGVISASNSLVGSTAGTLNDGGSYTGGDQVGFNGSGIGAIELEGGTGNYVVASPYWNNNTGAVTWGSGSTGVSGVISGTTNSLVGATAGATAGDFVGGSAPALGEGGVVPLSNGNYVVASPSWNGGMGAVTWGNGVDGGTIGTVSSTNSLVGSTTTDNLGGGSVNINYTTYTGITGLANGDYVVADPNWTNTATATANAGSVTWGDGSGGTTTGVVSSSNSLVGGLTGNADMLGSGGITALSDSNYIVISPNLSTGTSNGNVSGAVWLVAAPENSAALLSTGIANMGIITPSELSLADGADSSLTLQATEDIQVNSAVNVGGALSLLAGGTLEVNAGVTTGGTLDLESGGSMTVNAPLTGGTGLQLIAGETSLGTPAGNTSGGNLTINDDGDSTTGALTSLNNGNLSVAAPTGSISLLGNRVSVSSANQLSMTANTTFESTGGSISSANDATISTENGALTLTDTSLTTTAVGAQILSDNSTVDIESSLTIGGALTIEGTGGTNLNTSRPSNTIRATGVIDIQDFGGDIDEAGTLSSSAGDIIADAVNNLSISGAVSAAGNLYLTSDTGNINVNYDGDVNFGSLTTTTGDVQLNALLGGITVQSATTAGGNVSSSSQNGVNLAAITAGLGVTVSDTGGNVLLNGVAADGAITVSADAGYIYLTGALTDTSTSAVQLLAPAGNLYLQAPVNVDGSLTLTGLDGISLDYNSNNNNDSANGGVTATTGAGSFDAYGLTSSGGAITVQAANGIAFGDPVVADGALSLQTSGGDIYVFNDGSSNFGTLASGNAGDITLTATSGSITVQGNTNSAGQLLVTAGGAISMAAATATGAATESAVNAINIGSLGTPGAVSLSSSSSYVEINGALDSTGAGGINIQAPTGAIYAESNISTGGDLVLNAADDINLIYFSPTTNTVNVGGQLTATTTGGAFDAGQITTGTGSVNVHANTGITIYQPLLSAASITLLTDNDDLTVYNDGSGNLGSLQSQAGGDITLTATTGSVNVDGSTTSAGQLLVTAGNQINMAAATATSTVTEAALNAVNIGSLSTPGPVSLGSTNSSVELTGALDSSGTGGVNIQTPAGAIEAQSSISTGGDLVLNAADDINLIYYSATTNTVNVGGSLTATSSGGAFYAGQITTDAGPVSVHANTGIQIDQPLLSATAINLLTDNNNVLIYNDNGGNLGSLQSQAGDITLTATTGSITVDGSTNSAAGLTATAQTSITLNGTTVNGAVNLGSTGAPDSGGDINLDGGLLDTGKGLPLVQLSSAGGAVNADAGISVPGDLQITAVNDINLIASGVDNSLDSIGGSFTASTTAGGFDAGQITTGTGAVSVHANTGIRIDQPVLSATSITLLTDNNDLTVYNDGGGNLGSLQSQAGGDITLTATTGSVNVGGSTTSAGQLLVTAGNQINMAAATATGTVSETAVNAINIGSLSTPGSVSLGSTSSYVQLNGALDSSGSGGVTIQALANGIYAESNITSGGDLGLTALDDINLIYNSATNNVDTVAGNLTATTTGGGFDAGQITTASGLVNVHANTGIRIDQPLLSATSIDLVTDTGDLTVYNDGGGNLGSLQSQAGSDITLTASTGSVNVDGSTTSAGQLLVTAGNAINMAAATATGAVTESAANAITIGSLSTPGAVSLGSTSSYVELNGALDSSGTGGIDIQAPAGAIDAQSNITTGGDLILTALDDINLIYDGPTNNVVTVAGNLAANTTAGAFDAGQITTGTGFVQVHSNTGITIDQALNAAASLSLNTDNNALTVYNDGGGNLGSLTSHGGDITLIAGTGSVNVGGSTSSAGQLLVTAGDAINMAAATATSAVTESAANAINIGSLSTPGAVSLSSTNSDVQLSGALDSSGTGGITIQALAGAIDAQSNITTGGDLILTALDDINLIYDGPTNNVVTVAGNLTATTTAGAFDAGQISTNTGFVQVHSNTGITIDQALSAASSLSLTTDNNTLTVYNDGGGNLGSLTSHGGDITLAASNGNINVEGSTASAGALTATALTGISLGSTTVNGGVTISSTGTSDSGGDVNLYYGLLDTGTGQPLVQLSSAGGAVNADAGITVPGNLQIKAVNDINLIDSGPNNSLDSIGGSFTASTTAGGFDAGQITTGTGTVNVHANTGIRIDQPVLSATSITLVTDNNDLTVYNDGGGNLGSLQSQAGNDITLTATTGSVNVSGNTASAGQLLVTAGNAINMAAATATGTVTETAVNAITIGSLSTPGPVSLSSTDSYVLLTGALDSSGTGGINIQTLADGIYAQSSITTGGDLDLTASNAINLIYDSPTTNVDTVAGSLTATVPAGAFSAGQITTNTGFVQVHANTGITIDQPLSAATTLSLITDNGTLSVYNDGGGNLGSLTSHGGDTTLTATTGTVTVDGSTTSAGQLLVTAGSAINMAAATATSTVTEVAGGGISIGSLGTPGPVSLSTSNGNVQLNGALDSSGTGGITIQAPTGAIYAQSSGIATGGDLTLGAASDINLIYNGPNTNIDTVAGNFAATTTGGAFYAGQLSTGSGSVQVQAATGITIDQPVSAATTLSLNTGTGNLTVNNDGGGNLGGLSSLGGDMSLIASTGTITDEGPISSAGNLVASGGNGVNLVNVTAAGALTDTSNAGSSLDNVTAASVSVNAGTDASITGFLDTTLGGAQLQVANGQIDIEANLDIAGALTATASDTVFLNWSNSGNTVTVGGAASLQSTTTGAVDQDGALTAGGAVDLQGITAIQVDGSAASVGPLSLVVSNGNINANLLSAVNSTIVPSVTGDVTLTALAGSIAVNSVSAGGKVTAEAGNNLSASTVSAGAAVSLIADTGSEAIGSLADTGNASVLLQALQSTVDVEGTVNVAGTLTATDSGNLTFNWNSASYTANVGGALSLTSNDGQVLVDGTVTAGPTQMLGAGGVQDYGITTASGTLAVTATTGNIYAPGAFDASGDITLQALGGGITVNQGTNSSGGQVSAEAGTTMTLTGVSAAGPITLKADTGDLTVDGSLNSTGSGLLTQLEAPAGQVDVEANVNLAGALDISDSTQTLFNWYSTGNVATVGGAVSVITAGGITYLDDSLSNTAGDIVIEGGTGVQNDGAISAAGNLTLASTSTVTGDTDSSGSLTAAGNVVLSSAGGSVNTNSIIAGNEVTVSANQNISLNGGLTAVGAVSLTAATGNASIDGVLSDSGTAGVQVSAPLGSADVEAPAVIGGGLTVTAQGNALLNWNSPYDGETAAIAGTTSLTSTAGQVLVDGTLNSGPVVWAGAAGVQEDGIVTATGALSVTSSAGGISVSGQLNASGNITLQTMAGGSISTNQQTNAGGQLSVDASGNLYMVGVNAAGPITLTSDTGGVNIETLLKSTGAGLLTQLNAPEGTVEVEANVSLAGALDIGAGNATLFNWYSTGNVATVAGAVNIATAGGITYVNDSLGNTTGDIVIEGGTGIASSGSVASAGNLTLATTSTTTGDTDSSGSLTAAGNVVLSSAGGSVNTNSINAGNEVTATANQNIAMNGGLTAVGAVSLTASTGFANIDAVLNDSGTAGVQVSAPLGPADVEAPAVIGGSLTVSAQGNALLNWNSSGNTAAIAGTTSMTSTAGQVLVDGTLNSGPVVWAGAAGVQEDGIVTATGALSATSSAGGISVSGQLNASSNITLQTMAGGSISTNQQTNAGGQLSVDASGNLYMVGVNAAGPITLTSDTGGVNIETLLKSTGAGLLTQIQAPEGSVEVEANVSLAGALDIGAGNETLFNWYSTGNVATVAGAVSMVTAGGTTILNDSLSNTAGDIVIEGSTGVSNEAVIGAAGNLTLASTSTATGDTDSSGSLTAGGNVVLTSAGGSVNTYNTPVNAGGGVTVTANGSIGLNDGLVSNGPVTLTATTGSVDVDGVLTDTSGAVQITAPLSSVDIEAPITVGGSLTVTALDNATLNSDTSSNIETVGGPVTLTSTAGTVYQDGVLTVSSGATQLQGATGVVSGGSISAAGDLDLSAATGDIDTYAPLSSGGNVTFTATTGNININTGSTLTGPGAPATGLMQLDAPAGSVNTNAAVSNNGDLDISAGTGINIAGATQAAALTLGSAGGALDVSSAGSLTSTSGDINLSNTTSYIDVEGAVVSAGQFNATAATTVTMNSNSTAAGTASFTATAGNVQLGQSYDAAGTASFAAGGDITVNALGSNGGVDIETAITTPGQFNATAATGLTADSAVTAASINLVASADELLVGGSANLQTTAAGTLQLGATASDIRIFGTLNSSGETVAEAASYLAVYGPVAGAQGVGLTSGFGGGTGDVDIYYNSPYSFGSIASSAGPVTVTATDGNVAFNGANVSAAGTVTLAAGGGSLAVENVTSTAGDIDLSGTGVSVNAALSAGGQISVNSSQDFNLGAAASAGGAVTIAAAGNIYLYDPLTAGGAISAFANTGTFSLNGAATISTTATDTATGAALAVGGQSFNNDSTAGATVFSVPNGRWLVYSADPGATNKGGLTSDFRHYDATPASYTPADVTESGDGFIYASQAGTVLVSISDGGITGTTYGDAQPTYTFTLSGSFVDSEDNASTIGVSINPALNVGQPTAGNHAGTYNIAYQSGLVSSEGYTFVDNPDSDFTYTIAPRPVTLTGARTYDGSTTVLGSVLSVTNLVGSDSVTVSGTGTNDLAGQNAGSQTLVATTGLSLNDPDYTLVGATGSVDIAAKVLTISGSSVASKVYDGTTDATVAAGTLGGIVGTDSVDVQSSSGLFATSTVGNNINVAASYTLGGAEAADYSLGGQILTGDITPKALTLTGSTVASKVYDGTTSATVTAGSLTGFIAGDTVDVASASGLFATSTAGNNIDVAASYTLGGAQAVDYSLAGQTLTGDITQKALSISGSTVATKVYDGTTAATVNAGTLAGFVAGDTVDVASASGTFANQNVANNINVAASYTLGGAEAVDYSLAGQTLTGDITAKALSISGSTVATKVYDGTTAATVNAGTLAGFIAGDTVDVASASGVFANQNVANNINVAASYTLGGAEAVDYSLAGQTLTGDITAKALSIAGSTVASKVYDGTTAATVNAGTLAGFIAGDAVDVASSSGTFANKNVANNINVAASYTLGGAQAVDYSLAGQTLTGDITARALSISGSTVATKVYDGTTAATVNAGTLAGFIAGDTVDVASASGVFANQNVANNINVAASYTLGGAQAVDYSLAGQTLTGDITAKALSISGSTVATKVYDGTTAATVNAGTLSGLVAGDTVDVASSSGTFANKNVANNINVAASYTLGGAQAVDYSLAGQTLTGDITAKALSISGSTVATKVYDGTTAATVNAGTLAGFVAGDTVDVASASGTFANQNVANNINVAASYTLGGAQAVDYSLAGQTLTGDITAKALSISGSTVATKVYDGTTAATVNAGTLSGLVAGDTVDVASSSGTFANKNVANNINVAASYTLGGAEAVDYSLAGQTLTGDITAKALSISGSTVATKVYDGTTAATVNAGTLAGFIAGDTVDVASASGTFANQNVANNINVAASYTLGGAQAIDYSLAGQTLTGNITPATLDVTGVSGSKVYNATTLLTNPVFTYQAIGSDKVTVSGTANFASKDVGTGIVLTATALNLGGAQASDYVLPSTTIVGSGTITPATLTVTGVTGSKVYDGTTTLTMPSFTTTALAGDSVTVSGNVAFTKVGGLNIGIDATDLSLGGAQASDYVLAKTTVTGTGSITPAPYSGSGGLPPGQVVPPPPLPALAAETALNTLADAIAGSVVSSVSDDDRARGHADLSPDTQAGQEQTVSLVSIVDGGIRLP